MTSGSVSPSHRWGSIVGLDEHLESSPGVHSPFYITDRHACPYLPDLGHGPCSWIQRQPWMERPIRHSWPRDFAAAGPMSIAQPVVVPADVVSPYASRCGHSRRTDLNAVIGPATATKSCSGTARSASIRSTTPSIAHISEIGTGTQPYRHCPSALSRIPGRPLGRRDPLPGAAPGPAIDGSGRD